jgi:tetratricopeptide (TPR) repeat protein
MNKLIILILVGLCIGSAIAAKRDGIYIYTSIGEYCSEMYIPPPKPGADRVYFQGERIEIEAQLYNHAKVSQRVKFPESSERHLFDARVIKAPDDTAKVQVRITPSAKIEHERQTDMKPLAADVQEVRLGPDEALIEYLSIEDTSGLPVGVYTARLEPLVRAEPKAIRVNNNEFYFEIRAIETDEDRIELLRRQVCSLTRVRDDQNYQKALEKIIELLRLYPQCSAAYGFRGSIYAALGQYHLALKDSEQVLMLEQSGADWRWRKYATEVTIDNHVSAAKMTIESVKEKMKKRR